MKLGESDTRTAPVKKLLPKIRFFLVFFWASRSTETC
jgi:hypothetical protein